MLLDVPNVNEEKEKERKPLFDDGTKRKNKDIFTMSFRMSAQTALDLKKAADERNKTIQHIVATAVDEWMLKNTTGRFVYPKKDRGAKDQEG